MGASKCPQNSSTVETQCKMYVFNCYSEVWRRGWDSNPRLSFPNTRFPSVLLKPLGHLSVEGAVKSLAKLNG